MNHYIVYDRESYMIYETFSACGRDMINCLNQTPKTREWANITHPRHVETLKKIDAANNTNYANRPKTEAVSFKTIITVYWHGSEYPDLKIKHNEEWPHSEKTRNELVSFILNKGYSVMLKPNGDNLIMWIDKHRFGQK